METRLPHPDTSPSPAAFHYGAGHMIVHGNSAFIEVFGATSVGLPAREALVGLPTQAFELMDRVYKSGKPLAMRIKTPWGERRLVVAVRRDPETGETYGVTTHLRPVPVPEPASETAS
jgi:hypothetical protein